MTSLLTVHPCLSYSVAAGNARRYSPDSREAVRRVPSRRAADKCQSDASALTNASPPSGEAAKT